jgi:ribosomal protein L40E
MTRKTLGYVKLIWNCPNCGSRNPGPQKICSNCGSPQPDNVKFEQLPQAELITDQAEIAQATAGADVHCYYCGTRNSATAKVCSQCGADLTQAAARESGLVLDAPQPGPAQPLICPSCGTPNDLNASKCVQCGAVLTQPQPVSPQFAAPMPARKASFPPLVLIGGAVLLLGVIGACIFFLVLSGRTTDITGQVESVSWERRILVQQLVPVSGQDWQDELPPGAVVGSCSERQRGSESRFTGETREVCGTPYSVETGTGFGEVTQDCETEQIYEEVPVYGDYCSYTATVWQTVPGPALTGNSLNAQWPQTSLLNSNQREAGREERYTVVFRAGDKNYTYTPRDFNEFQKLQIGSQWTLNVNTFGTITSIEPGQGE